MQKSTSTGIFHGWYIVATGAFLSLLAMGTVSGFGVFVIPMSEEFGWNRSTVSIAAAVASLAGGLSQPVAGRIFDRVGGRKLVLIGLIIWGGASVLLTFTNHIIFLVLVFGIVMSLGVGAGSMNTMAVLVSRWFQRRRATAVAFISAGGSLGGLMLVPLISFAIPLIGWRFSWLMLGLSVLILGLPMAYLLIKNDPREVGYLPDGDAIPHGENGDEAVKVQKAPLEVGNWMEAFRSVPMWQLIGGYMVCGITTNLISAHYVPYAIEEGFSPAVSATAFGVLSAMNLVGVLTVGFLGDKFGRKNLLTLVYAVRGIGFAILLIAPGYWGLFGFAVVGGVAWLATVPLTTALTADVYGLRNVGVLSGMVFMFHQLGGAASIQLGGIMRDMTGDYTLPFAIAGLSLAFATVVSFMIKETRYSVRYQSVATPAQAAGD